MKKAACITALLLAAAVQLKAQQLPKFNFRDSLLAASPLMADSLLKFNGNKFQYFNKPGNTVYSNLPAVKKYSGYNMPVVNPAEKGVHYTMLIKRVDMPSAMPNAFKNQSK